MNLGEGGMGKDEAGWGLEEEDDAGAELKLAHLLSGTQLHRRLLLELSPHLHTHSVFSIVFESVDDSQRAAVIS